MMLHALPDTEQDVIPRDQWKRPLIYEPGSDIGVGYTRVSTLAKRLDDTEGLTKWKAMMTAEGFATRPDLLALFQAAKDKTEKYALCQQALDLASGASNMGTALHAHSEREDAGDRHVGLAQPVQRDLDAYSRTMKAYDVQVLGSEVFVAVTDVRAAGTFDRLLRVPDLGDVVADIKTGKDNERPHGACIQTAIYAHGQRYWHQGQWGVSLADLGVRQDVTLMIWLPQGKGVCELYVLDAVEGWAMAQTAADVRGWYKDVSPIMHLDKWTTA